MLKIFHNWILFCILLEVSSGHDFPFPILNGCRFASDLIDFCTTEFNFCIGQKSILSFCSLKFCDCSKTSIPPSEEKCRDNITNTCRLLQKRKKDDGKALVANNSPFKWPTDLKLILSELQESCGLDTKKEELSLKDFVTMIPTNECVQKQKRRIDDSLTKLNTAISKELDVPFDRFRCGSHYGDMGKVMSRFWINGACGSYSVDFNHCCAKHLNCYMNRNEKEDCDEQFSSCRKNLVSRMISHKESCLALISSSNHEIFLPSLDYYKLFDNIKITTRLSLFDGKLNYPILSSTNLNLSQIMVFRLSASASLNHDVQNMFNKDIYKTGWSNRVTIDSCGMIFEDCRKHNKLSTWSTKLVFCLYGIDEKGEEFEIVLREFNRTLSSQFIEPPSKTEVQEMIDHGLLGHQLMMYVEFLLLAIWLISKVWKYRRLLPECCINCCKICQSDPLPAPDQQEDIEMVEQTVDRNERDELLQRGPNGTADVDT